MRDFSFSRRELLGALFLAVLLVLGLVLRFILLPRPAGDIVIEKGEREQPVQVAGEIVVHVAGAVKNPGVYTLAEGARVFEALEAAGGTVPEAESDAINLAAPLYDGQKVRVPFASERAAPGTAGEDDGRVNINTASVSQLEKLPGLGPVKAAAIVSYREKNGPFKSVADLAKVSGIGEKTVEVLIDHVTLY